MMLITYVSSFAAPRWQALNSVLHALFHWILHHFMRRIAGTSSPLAMCSCAHLCLLRADVLTSGTPALAQDALYAVLALAFVARAWVERQPAP